MIYGLYLVYEEIIIENLVFIRFEEFGILVFVGKDNWKGGVMIVRLVWIFELDSLVGRIFGKKVEDLFRLYLWLS